MDLKDKICLITGATSGIGLETAKELARQGAVLVLPYRNNRKAENLKKILQQEAPDAKMEFIFCDLSSLSSIREFSNVFRQKYSNLHLLINNAGIWEPKKQLSKDGIEMNFAVNHLAPFLLTNLLLDILIKSAPARIINVSSEAHRQADIYFDDIEFEKKYSCLKSYSQSKLANILFTKKLSQKLKGTGVTANCLHPGVVATSLFDKMPRLLVKAMSLFMITPISGAKTTLYLATSPELEKVSGEYFAKSKKKKPSANGLRQSVADKLWELSERYVGLS